MLTGIDPAGAQFLADLARTRAGIDQAQRQVETGSRVNRPSDDPDAVSDILRLRADILRTQQIQSNLSNVKPEVDTGEQSLQSAVQLLDRASVLAAQGVSTTQTAGARQAIAKEAQSILEQLVGLSRTAVGGRFIFSGDQDAQAPYELDTQQPDTGAGVVQLVTSGATRQVQDAVGNTFVVTMTAQQIFDDQDPPGTPAADNAFVAVNQLRVALQANDTTGIGNALVTLRQAGDYINSQLSFYGTAQNRIVAASDQASNLILQFQTALSYRQDADITQAIVQMNQGRTQEQASLQSEAQVPRTSLFDFLA
jgi:flagellar hook-associated protein 3 FlgL